MKNLFLDYKRTASRAKSFRLFVLTVSPQTFWSRAYRWYFLKAWVDVQKFSEIQYRVRFDSRDAFPSNIYIYFFSALHTIQMSRNSLGTNVFSSSSYIPVICIMRTYIHVFEKSSEYMRLLTYTCSNIMYITHVIYNYKKELDYEDKYYINVDIYYVLLLLMLLISRIAKRWQY